MSLQSLAPLLTTAEKFRVKTRRLVRGEKEEAEYRAAVRELEQEAVKHEVQMFKIGRSFLWSEEEVAAMVYRSSMMYRVEVGFEKRKGLRRRDFVGDFVCSKFC